MLFQHVCIQLKLCYIITVHQTGCSGETKKFCTYLAYHELESAVAATVTVTATVTVIIIIIIIIIIINEFANGGRWLAS